MKKNILIGITSSISAYKIYELIRKFRIKDYNVKVVLSENAKLFVSPLVIETLTNSKVYFEQFEPRTDVQHIGLVEWADVFVIAPITANTISKISNGIADNLLTSIACAYIGSNKPMIIAPAMNDNMWDNTIIQENIEKLKSKNIEIIEPEIGFLACGKNGKGRLAKIELIYHNTIRQLFQNKENNNKKVVVTIGGTKEYIDNVRYITNASSGKMGSALAIWAYYLGYQVSAITTIDIDLPIKIINANSAQDMLDDLKKQDFNYLIMAAAIADFRVENKAENKISKEEIDKNLILNLIKNPDVVATIAQNKKDNQKIIGFCLTDKDLINCAKKKLENKNLDYIIANEINIALNKNDNQVTIIDKSGKMIDIERDTKENIAKKILEVVCD